MTMSETEVIVSKQPLRPVRTRYATRRNHVTETEYTERQVLRNQRER